MVCTKQMIMDLLGFVGLWNSS